MWRCGWLTALVVLTGCVTATRGLAEDPAEATKGPNVIVIVSDDMGYADLGVHGSREIKTPNFDRLAQDGVRFTQGYVTASVCCPSRAGLLTGRYQQRFGHEFNGFWPLNPGYTEDDQGLPVDEKTIGDAMQAAGYKTIAIGKWHMGDREQFFMLNRGFDECYAIKSGNRSYWPYKEDVSEARRIWRNRELVPEEEIVYLTDSLTDAAVDFIEREAEEDKPFFMYLSYTAPHTPMHGKADDIEDYRHLTPQNRRVYAAMMKSLDEGVGRVRDTLTAQGIDENTLIIFINDNGGATNNGSDNGQYRGMKGSKWEGGIRVPYTMTWPGHVPSGRTYNHPVSALDILPTALGAADAAYPYDKELDGVNLLPFVRGEVKGKPHETLYWRRGVAAAVRDGDWKLIRTEGSPDLLFNLKTDPGERNNLARKNPRKLAELKAKLEAWESGMVEPIWSEGDKWERNQVMKHRMEINTRALERRYP